MEKLFVCFMLCLSGTAAFWNLHQIPEILKEVVKNEEPKNILNTIWDSDEIHHLRDDLDKKKSDILENILRFGTAELVRGNVGDEGHATNCGPPSHSFSLTWQPKKPKTTDSVSIQLNLTSSENLSKGTIKLLVYMDGILVIQQKLDLCTVIPQVGLNCPIRKGQKINLPYTIKDISMMPPTKYKILASITDDKGAVYVCAAINVAIQK